MLAKINTKSNYRKLNGTIQTVKEIVGNRVTCMIFAPEFGKYIQADFTLNECDIITGYKPRSKSAVCVRNAQGKGFKVSVDMVKRYNQVSA